MGLEQNDGASDICTFPHIDQSRVMEILGHDIYPIPLCLVRDYALCQHNATEDSTLQRTITGALSSVQRKFKELSQGEEALFIRFSRPLVKRGDDGWDISPYGVRYFLTQKSIPRLRYFGPERMQVWKASIVAIYLEFHTKDNTLASS